MSQVRLLAEASPWGRSAARRIRPPIAGATPRIRHGRVIPPVLLRVGDLLGIIYRPAPGRNLVHLMRQPPLLATDLGGRQLYIVGGKYRMTPFGLVE